MHGVVRLEREPLRGSALASLCQVRNNRFWLRSLAEPQLDRSFLGAVNLLKLILHEVGGALYWVWPLMPGPDYWGMGLCP